MLKVTISVGGDAIAIEGDVGFAEALPLITSWFASLAVAQELARERATLQEMTARLSKSTAALSDAERVAAAT
jgi:hypothetical protein